MDGRSFINYYINITHALYMLNKDLKKLEKQRVIYVGRFLYDYVQVNWRVVKDDFTQVRKHVVRLDEHLSNYNYVINDSDIIISDIKDLL